MEPQGQHLTPATSYGPTPLNLAQNPGTPSFLSCNLQSLCSSQVRDGLMSAKGSCGIIEDEGPRQPKGTHPSTEAERRAQKRFRSSAFPSSLSWDSDSEKETADDEELQHFSNPHGLAAHSPGSPSSGLRLDSEDNQEPKKQQHLHRKNDSHYLVEGLEDNNKNTKQKEPNRSQLHPTELTTSKVCNVSGGAEVFLASKAQGSCQMEEEADSSKRENRPKGQEVKESERDVYSFLGESDPERPPPAPWAHCTFIQQCRKKRVLLKPFSGLGTSEHMLPESGKQARVSLQKSKPSELAQLNQGGGDYNFTDDNQNREGAAEKLKFGVQGRRMEEQDKVEESDLVLGREIFTCVKCSIYFKKQVHLQEHIGEHCQSSVGGGRHLGKDSRFLCSECGWKLPNQLALVHHYKKHQESRLKILEEIEKLNKNRKAGEIQKMETKVVVDISPDPCIIQGTSGVTSKEYDLETVTSPLLSALPNSTSDATVIDSDRTLPTSIPNLVHARSASSHRRRFVCTKCNFSTRTPQALANHSKAHKKENPAPQTDSISSATSTPLPCGSCPFLTSSQTVMSEHQKSVHSGQASTSGGQADGQQSRSEADVKISKPVVDTDYFSGTGSTSLPEIIQGKIQQETMISAEGSAVADSAAVSATNQEAFKSFLNTKFCIKWKTSVDLTKPFSSKDEELSGSEEQDAGHNIELDPDSSKEEAHSLVGVKPHTRSQSNIDDSSTQSTTSLPSKCVEDKDKPEVEKEGKVFFLRSSKRVPVETDSNDGDSADEEHIQHFLSKGILDEDEDEINYEAEALKSVERKCPYCPDRFHNGIGLANHVRGHLNRVGVSYNVRHFISPEEVNAIEKKFSYQRKKKKVANFDPDTFSLMHCEFCSAGFDTRAGLSSHARAHLRDFGITNWDVTVSPIHILRELFSSRPDLVIPMAPPRSPSSSLEEDEKTKIEEIIEVKLAKEMSQRTLNAAPASRSPHQFKKERRVIKGEAEEEEEKTSEEEDEQQLPALDSVKTGHRSVEKDSLSPREDADSVVHSLTREVRGGQQDTRQRLSTHACSNVLELGISFPESSRTSTGILYQTAKEHSSQISSPVLEPLAAKKSSLSVPQKDEDLEDMDLDKKPISLSVLAKAAKAPSSSSTPTSSPAASPAPPVSGTPPSVVRKAPISSLLPVSSPLRSPENKTGGVKNLTSNHSGPFTLTTTKPLWAPQENDAPLSLTLDVDINKDIVCQLCGAWFETRKGLSSHARAHLRHFGLEYSESKGSPIDLLNHLIDADEFKHKANVHQLDSHSESPGYMNTLSSQKQSTRLNLPSSSSSSSPSSSLIYKVTTAGSGSTSKTTSSSSTLPLFGPPAKRQKSSSMRVFRLSSGELMALPHSEPPKEIGCEFCGEYFENRKGLSSHARSHLRQMGITEWSVNGSPIDTLREIIIRRGLPCALPLKSVKSRTPSSPGPPRSPLPASSSTSPSANLLSRLPFAFAHPSSPPQSISKSSSAPTTSSSSGLILKLKPEPAQLEVTTPGNVGKSDGVSGETLNWSSSDSVFPLNLAMAHEQEPTRDIRCEFCGEYFENRKGLSSHARSHLRQMGITEWSVNGSPIDTLKEVMHNRGQCLSSHSDQEVKNELIQGATSPSWDNTRGTGSSEGLTVSGYQSSKFRKSPLKLLQSRSRLHKQSLVSTSSATSTGKIFRTTPLGQRPQSEEAQSLEPSHSPSPKIKTFSAQPHDFSFKRKPSPDKHGHQDPSCELCGFFFENRKALASHARAHLRQFGVTEWSVNGSPIETLSAWIRSRPQNVLEMHRSYMQGNRSTLKKKDSSTSSSSPSQRSSSLTASLVKPLSCEISETGSSKRAESDGGSNQLTTQPGHSSSNLSRLRSSLPLQAQVARSELNVRLPRGFERRPLKHPSCPDGTERDIGPPHPPRTGTIPALVPKPPSYSLVKVVGKFYTLKCRFCEVEFHGPLSVQEDWIRHIQQHILKMNYNKPVAPKASSVGLCDPDEDLAPVCAPASTCSTISTIPALTITPSHTTDSSSSSTPSPPDETRTTVIATEIVKVSEEQPSLSPASQILPPQTM